MTQPGHRLFCSIAMAADVLCKRWTLMLVSELLAGTTRFNELRRGLPRMSPALLSQRLKELEDAGIVVRAVSGADAPFQEYRLTQAGLDLGPVVLAFGSWGHRWIETEVRLNNLDVQVLMWTIRRKLNTRPMPPRRSVIEFIYPELPPAQRVYWLIVEPGKEVELCAIDPGFDVDLYVSVDLRTMTAIWMGQETIPAALASGRMILTGDRELAAAMQSWLGVSRFAKEHQLAG